MATSYLSRPPERLVLEGYRHWTHGLAQKSQDRFEALAVLYDDTLGAGNAGPTLAAFQEFICTAGLCAICPLKMLRSNCQGLCRDEAMILGLVSGLQNGDTQSTELCLRAIAPPERIDQLAHSAGTFAYLLRGLGQTLMPIPPGALHGVLSSSRHPDSPEKAARPTLH